MVDAHSDHLRYWAGEFQERPNEIGPNVVTRCRDLAKQLTTGLIDGVEGEAAILSWHHAKLEFRQLVVLAEKGGNSTFPEWLRRGVLSADAAEAMVDAADTLRDTMGHPGRAPGGKKQLLEPLGNFLKAVAIAVPKPKRVNADKPKPGTDADKAFRLMKRKPNLKTGEVADLAKVSTDTVTTTKRRYIRKKTDTTRH